MDKDLLAAAAAAGCHVPCGIEMKYETGNYAGNARPGAAVAADPYNLMAYEDPGIFDLPNVDDLEVAAAAAAAALEVLAPAPKPGHWGGGGRIGESDDEDSDSNDSDDDDSSDDDSDSDDSSSGDAEEAARAVAGAPVASSSAPISVHFDVAPTNAAGGDGVLHLRLSHKVQNPATGAATAAAAATLAAVTASKAAEATAGDDDVTMREVEADSDPLSSSSEDDDSNDDDDSDSDDSSGHCSSGAAGKAARAAAGASVAAAAAAAPISVRFDVAPTDAAGGDGVLHLRLSYKVHDSATAAAAATAGDDDVVMREVETDSDPLSSSSEDEDDVAAAAAAASSRMVDDDELQALDHEGMKDLIARAYAATGAEDDDDDVGGGGGGGGGGGAQSALHELGLPPTAPDLSGVEVTAEDVLEPAGCFLSVFEGMVVAQGLVNSRPLAEGSLVLAEDRTPLGLVEEVFGPVAHPLYAFRHAVKGPLPACVKPGAPLFVVQRLARLLTVDEIFGSATRCAEPEPASDDEVYFSDDEAEQHYLRQQVAKRKGAPDGGCAEGPAAAAVDGGCGGGRPRQRSRAATGAKGPGIHFKVSATAGAMSALLGLHGNDGSRSGGAAAAGRYGGGGGRGSGRGTNRGGGGGGGRASSRQGHSTAQQGSGWASAAAVGGAGGGGGGGGQWMRPLRDDDVGPQPSAHEPLGAQHPPPPPPHPPHHHHHPQSCPYPLNQSYRSTGGPPPQQAYHSIGGLPPQQPYHGGPPPQQQPYYGSGGPQLQPAQSYYGSGGPQPPQQPYYGSGGLQQQPEQSYYSSGGPQPQQQPYHQRPRPLHNGPPVLPPGPEAPSYQLPVMYGTQQPPPTGYGTGYGQQQPQSYCPPAQPPYQCSRGAVARSVAQPHQHPHPHYQQTSGSGASPPGPGQFPPQQYGNGQPYGGGRAPPGQPW